MRGSTGGGELLASCIVRQRVKWAREECGEHAHRTRRGRECEPQAEHFPRTNQPRSAAPRAALEIGAAGRGRAKGFPSQQLHSLAHHLLSISNTHCVNSKKNCLAFDVMPLHHAVQFELLLVLLVLLVVLLLRSLIVVVCTWRCTWWRQTVTVHIMCCDGGCTAARREERAGIPAVVSRHHPVRRGWHRPTVRVV